MENSITDSFTFAKFAEEFSVDVPEQDSGSRFDFRKVPGITDFSSLVSMMKTPRLEDLYFMGVIGSVDNVFSYIANLNPARSFLFDKNPLRVPYLGMRVCLLKSSQIVEDAYLKMICASEEQRGTLSLMDHDERKGFLTNPALLDLSGYAISDQGHKFMRDLGYDHPSKYISSLFTGMPDDQDFKLRRHFAGETLDSMMKSEHRMGKRLAWTDEQNFRALWQYAWGNRIKGFHADLYSGFERIAKRIIRAYGIRNLAVHISNLGEEGEYAESQSSMSDAFGSLPDSLDNLIVVSERARVGPYFHIWTPVRKS